MQITFGLVSGFLTLIPILGYAPNYIHRRSGYELDDIKRSDPELADRLEAHRKQCSQVWPPYFKYAKSRILCTNCNADVTHPRTEENNGSDRG